MQNGRPPETRAAFPVSGFLSCVISGHSFNLDPAQKSETDTIELGSEFLHRCIFAGNFSSLSTVESNLSRD